VSIGRNAAIPPRRILLPTVVVSLKWLQRHIEVKKKKMYDSDGGQVVAAHCGDSTANTHKMSRFQYRLQTGARTKSDLFDLSTNEVNFFFTFSIFRQTK
jgi:hypothetical protein